MIDEFASTGSADASSLDFFTEIFLDTSAENVQHALSPNLALKPGLTLIKTSTKTPANPDNRRQLSYTLQCIELMKHLMARKDLLEILRSTIPEIQKMEMVDDRLLAIGALYERTLSTLPFRIQIRGSQGYLRQPMVAQKIRGLLFCAVRYAILWQQRGGTKFDFLLRRANIHRLSQEILNNKLN